MIDAPWQESLKRRDDINKVTEKRWGMANVKHEIWD
jgi:hypothetical protein